MTRTDGDSWDLASSVGATATSVAASRALASKGPDALIDDPYADALVKAVGLEAFVKVAEGQVHVPGDPILDRRRMSEQIAVRTRFFDDFFTDACASGVRQAVILASGLDTRAYRLEWPSGMVVFEIDQPQVIEFKTRVLADAGATPAADRRTVAVDLRDDWAQALQDSGFDPEAPTAWIAEGLLVYLPPDAQDRLFDHITALSAPGSRLATEHMDTTALPENWAAELTERAKRVGSDIDLAALFYTGERTPAGVYLADHGWQVSTVSSTEAYAANGFAFPEDDLLRVFGDSGYLSATLTT